MLWGCQCVIAIISFSVAPLLRESSLVTAADFVMRDVGAVSASVDASMSVATVVADASVCSIISIGGLLVGATPCRSHHPQPRRSHGQGKAGSLSGSV